MACHIITIKQRMYNPSVAAPPLAPTIEDAIKSSFGGEFQAQRWLESLSTPDLTVSTLPFIILVVAHHTHLYIQSDAGGEALMSLWQACLYLINQARPGHPSSNIAYFVACILRR